MMIQEILRTKQNQLEHVPEVIRSFGKKGVGVGRIRALAAVEEFHGLCFGGPDSMSAYKRMAEQVAHSTYRTSLQVTYQVGREEKEKQALRGVEMHTVH